jgi:hypothetical protein
MPIRLDGAGVEGLSHGDERLLRDVEGRLLERLNLAKHCDGFAHEPRVCLYETVSGRLAVSVTDCCCDYHAQLVLEEARQELQR